MNTLMIILIILFFISLVISVVSFLIYYTIKINQIWEHILSGIFIYSIITYIVVSFIICIIYIVGSINYFLN